MRKTKRNKVIAEKVDTTKEYTVFDAINVLKESSGVNFVESLDCAMRLGVDPRHADQMIRGTVSLPNGTGKDVKVLVIAKDAKVKEALDAGADFAGMEEYIDRKSVV